MSETPNIITSSEPIDSTPVAEILEMGNTVPTDISETIEKETVTPQEEKPKFQELIEFFRDIIVILVVVLIIRTYIGAPFQISGHSMDNSYHDREFILVNKFSYADFGIARVGNPERGDVVILKPHAANGKEYYIKRVVGLPGEIVKFDSGEVYIKKVGSDKFLKINEDYLNKNIKGRTFIIDMSVKEREFTVPADEYFVMGDNRPDSSDSRSCFMSCTISGSTHFVSRDNVVGKVFLDFGYKNIFSKNDLSAPPDSPARFFNTPKDWDYTELN